MNIKWILLLLLVPAALLYQNCSDIKSLPSDVNSSVDGDEGGGSGGGGGNGTCTPISPAISEQLQGNELALNLRQVSQAVEASWIIRNEAGDLLDQSPGSSISTYNFDYTNVVNCRVVVIAEYQTCNRLLRAQKTIQIRSCGTVTPPPPTNLVEPIAGCVPSYPNQMTANWIGTPTNPWPSLGRRARLFVSKNSTLSYRFTTPPNRTSLPGPGFGTFATADFPEDGDGILKMTISVSEGCTNSAKLHPNCAPPPTRYAGVGWSLLGAPGFSCPLEYGKTYYINLTYGNNSSYIDGQPYCPVSICGVDFQNQ